MEAMSDDKRLVKYVDEAMYKAEEIDASKGPQVYLVNMTSDPLGSVAVFSAMYKGDVKRSLSDVTDEERAYYLEQMMATKLKAPLEAIHFHFLIEGVTRAFTHQQVRQRTAVYAQESMRFAVKETMPVGLPPSLQGTMSNEQWVAENRGRIGASGLDVIFDLESDAQKNRIEWDRCVKIIEETYNRMVARGMPAEDARGLAPTNVLTRINYDTNLRNLLDHAGNRLCTQAQFEWRLVLAQMTQAIRGGYRLDTRWQKLAAVGDDSPEEDKRNWNERITAIEQEYTAIASLFKPVCYLTGRCEFGAEFDRKCSIRQRVQANADLNRPSSEWDSELDKVEGNPVVAGVGPRSVVRDGDRPVFIGAIKPEEWLLDPAAAR